MKSNRAKFMALLACAALIAMLGLAACGGSSSSSSSAASSSATASASSSASTSASESSSTSAEELFVASNFPNWNGWAGTSDLNETFYYIESPEGDKGIMVVATDDKKYVSYVGPVTNPQEAYVTITDDSTGNSLTFEVIDADENRNITIDMGEQGKANLAKTDLEKVLAEIKRINNDYTPVA